MSSLIRRIERQMYPSKPVHQEVTETRAGPIVRYVSNPPRHVFYKGRGSKLGLHNPKDKALIARLAREERNRARKAATA
jgi:hypothetical protein